MTRPYTLPEEVLSIISSYLGLAQDFATLFACSLASKSLADSALRVAYQYHELSNAFTQPDDLVLRAKDQDRLFRKWMLLWRSIIASAVQPRCTYKPYSRYLRILDFRNLLDMLESAHKFYKFRSEFYQEPLRQFEHMRSGARSGAKLIDIVATINHVGEVVLLKHAPLLEELAGVLRPGFLPRWVTGLSRLKSLTLHDGDALDQECGEVIAKHCEQFQDLTVKSLRGPEADRVFASFLRALPGNSLQQMTFISRSDIHRETFAALSERHGLSVRDLRLDLCEDAVFSLCVLKGCTRLEVLVLEDGVGSVEIGKLDKTAMEDCVSWLVSCAKLKEIRFKGLRDGPRLLGKAAASGQAAWQDLRVQDYSMCAKDSISFHNSLARVPTLESLHLQADSDDATALDHKTLVDTLCALPRLRDLSLLEIADGFDEADLAQIFSHTILLERLCTGADIMTDQTLEALTLLRHLKSFTALAISRFSFDALLAYINQLDPNTQRGMLLSIQAADPDTDACDDGMQSLLNQAMIDRIEGRFGMCVLPRTHPDADWNLVQSLLMTW